MSAFTSVVPRFWVRRSRLYHYNSAVIEGDNLTVLIDPGIYPDELQQIEQFARRERTPPIAIVLTHGDWDHVLGPERLLADDIITHTSYPTEMITKSESTLRQLTQWERNAAILRTKPFVLPKPTRLVEHGGVIDVAPFHFTVIHAPGHAPEQIALYEPEQGILWAADMLSDIEIPFVCSSVRAYINTLQCLRSLSIEAAIPGHGSVLRDRDTIESIIEADLRYLEALNLTVQRCVDAGASIAESVAACASIPLRFAAAQEAHQMNVETIFKELGGAPGDTPIGWSRYVETAA